MSKKKKPAKRAGHPARRSHLNLVGEVSTADTALQLTFAAWYRKHAADYDDHPEPEAFQALTMLLFRTAALRGLSLGLPTVDVIDTVLGTIADDPELSELEVSSLDVLMHLLEFLAETDTWTGTDDDFDDATEFVAGLLDALEDDEPDELLDELLAGLDHLPTIPDTDQIAALNEMTPIAAVGGLLDWIDSGKEVTSTGGLRLADIEPVAALLGIPAVGKRGAPQPLQRHMREFDDPTDDTPVEVGSMWDLFELQRWWSTLTEMGLIETSSTRLRVGPRADEWRSTDPATALAVRSELLGLYLTAWSGSASAMPEIAPHRMLQNLTQLSAAVSPDIHPEMSSDDLKERMIAASPPDDSPVDLARIAGDLTQDTLRHFETMRMLSATPTADGSGRFVVAEAARPAFATGIRFANSSFAPGFTPGSSVLPSQHPAGTVLRLKITLMDSKPAVWRRVTISADATLGDLHEVIQAVFGWQNTHLHQFFDGNKWAGGEVTFTDPEFAQYFEEEIEDEFGYALGAFFEEPGDEFRYVYDFGDDWRHVIRLERIEPEGTDAGPHCIGGRGRAPMDDSGGVYGWADKLRIASDPNDPDYAEIREWLELAPDEVLDPAEFSVAQADGELESLREN